MPHKPAPGPNDTIVAFLRQNGRGYTIHIATVADGYDGTALAGVLPIYELYTVAGEFVCESGDFWWLSLIARALNEHFDALGN